MEDSICINVTLSRIEACLLVDDLRLLHAGYFKKHWDEQRFSAIPIEHRKNAMLAAIPSMAAQQQLITTLTESIWRRTNR
ncbi:hypothetical protein NQ186_10010 [Pseudomonas zeae]|uniref:hypothetical protein n=1 Tax=Pseudomonas zeae TaxID=2745510 RepID=UPI00214792CB|nr:hypothetical protein [Pseudomonas zeae]UUT14498.1 hypothetical protein NQ186_10010 [Pseudomonas zeae]